MAYIRSESVENFRKNEISSSSIQNHGGICVDVKEMAVHSIVIFLEVAAEALGTSMDRIPCFRLALTLC